MSIFGQVFGDGSTPVPVPPPPPPITAWSYSRLSVYEGCPRRAKYQFVDKVPEAESDAIVRGKAVHEAMAAALVSGTEAVTDDVDILNVVAPWSGKLEALRAMNVRAEYSAAFDIDWATCDWFSRKTWLRVVYDVIVPPQPGGDTVLVLDWKTGKPRDSHADQVSLYGCGAQALYPEVQNFEVCFVYLDYPQRAPTIRKFTSTDLLLKRGEWEVRASAMLRETDFPTRVGPGCRWCPYAKSKGGPCEQG